MTNLCQACGSPTELYLCQNCTDCRRRTDNRCSHCLTDHLAELPAGIHDLAVTATRQARVGNLPPRLSPQALAELEQADAEESDVPARLRSLHGRITLVATSSPIAYEAATLHDEAVNTLLTWARHIAETRGAELPTGETIRVVAEHRAVTGRDELVESCTWRWQRRPVTAETIATWLIDNIDSIRLDETAGQLLAAFADLTERIEHTVDRRDPEVFVGPCTAQDVAVTSLPVTGPACTSLACPHESCEQVRRGAHALAPTVRECGHPLLTTPEASEVTCEACGTVYVVTDHRAVIADKLADHLGTVSEVAGYLRTLTMSVDGEVVPLEVNVDRINGWIFRGRVSVHGHDANGRKLVQVGEVRDQAESVTRKRGRRTGRMAS